MRMSAVVGQAALRHNNSSNVLTGLRAKQRMDHSTHLMRTSLPHASAQPLLNFWSACSQGLAANNCISTHLTRTSLPHASARPCSISGMWRWRVTE